MATIRVPANCSSITLATDGVLTPDGSSNISVATVANVNDILHPSNVPVAQKTASNGDATMFMSSKITSITLNGSAYAVTSGVSAAIPAARATQLWKEGFRYVKA